MLASLRSDTWTTSPEQVDGLTGIRNRRFSCLADLGASWSSCTPYVRNPLVAFRLRRLIIVGCDLPR